MNLEANNDDLGKDLPPTLHQSLRTSSSVDSITQAKALHAQRLRIPLDETGDSNALVEERKIDDKKRESVLVDKQALIDAILELERQNEIEATLMLGYIKHLKALAAHLESVMQAERSTHAKNLLYRHFLPDEDWVQLFTNERIQTWQDEANTMSHLT